MFEDSQPLVGVLLGVSASTANTKRLKLSAFSPRCGSNPGSQYNQQLTKYL